MRSFSDSYREAGVNIEAGYEGVRLMKKHVARTMIPGVVSDIGGFESKEKSLFPADRLALPIA